VKALPRPGGEELREAPAGGIAPDDVVLEVDPAAGPADDVVHRAVGVRTVNQQADRVAGDRSPPGGTIASACDRLGRAPARNFGHRPARPISLSRGPSAARPHRIWSCV